MQTILLESQSLPQPLPEPSGRSLHTMCDPLPTAHPGSHGPSVPSQGGIQRHQLGAVKLMRRRGTARRLQLAGNAGKEILGRTRIQLSKLRMGGCTLSSLDLLEEQSSAPALHLNEPPHSHCQEQLGRVWGCTDGFQLPGSQQSIQSLVGGKTKAHSVIQ